MGACPSTRKPTGRGPTGEVRLLHSKLVFSATQLTRINTQIAAREADRGEECPDAVARDALVDSVVERLVQRLICGVGMLDQRFACKFLASMDAPRHRRPGKHRHSYLVRLDKLSAPALYDLPQPSVRVAEGSGGDGSPPGFAKLRAQGEGVDEWAEFISQGGFLRRDRIQERFVELLAMAAAHSPDSPDLVDESLFCASPGKVVDVGVLQRIMEIPAGDQVFFGAASSDRTRYPDPRDFRIAIMESSPYVRLRVGCLSPRLDEGARGGRDVKLVLGVGALGWPITSDYPARVALGHVDCLLHQQAAQTGFYLIPEAPHPSLRCDDRPCTWAMWMPAAELCLTTHYSSDSVVMRVMAAVDDAVEEAARGEAYGGEQRRVASRHAVLSTSLWRLEGVATSSLLGWAPGTLSRHLVESLDALGESLRTPRRSYFFPGREATGGEEGDEAADAIVEYLKTLHSASLSPAPSASLDVAALDAYQDAVRVETLLLRKWDGLLKDLSPPSTTRSTRMGFLSSSTVLGHNSAAASQYSSRQLDYIGHLFREMLKVRQLLLQNQPSPWLQPNVIGDPREDSVEDLVYLITAILDQAKEIALQNAPHLKGPRKDRRQRGDAVARLKAQFETATLYLVDSVRNDADTLEMDFADDLVLVRHVLKWLYRALDEDRRNFGPVLRPYLNSIFLASHQNGWHLEEVRKRQNIFKSNGNLNELEALGDFCKLVVGKKMDAGEAIADAIPKKWLWAKNMSDVGEFLHVTSALSGLDIEGSLCQGLPLVFVPDAGCTVREVVEVSVTFGAVRSGSVRSRFSTISGRGRNGDAMTLMKSQTLGRGKEGGPVTAVAVHEGLLSRLHAACYTASVRGSSPRPPPAPHPRLRDASPLTLAIDAGRRYGHHRGVGDVVAAIVALQKFSILQEVSSLLPDEQRTQVLDVIQKLAKETRRVSALRKLRQPPPQKPKTPAKSSKHSSKIAPLPTYRSNNELSVVPTLSKEQKELIGEREKELELELRKLKQESLLGTVRATRAQNSRPTVFGCESFFEEKRAPMSYRYQVEDGTRSLAVRGGDGGRLPYRYGETEGTMSLGHRYGETEGRLYRCGDDDRDVALLELTEDRQLRLGPAGFVAQRRGGGSRNKDVITKL